MHIGNWTKPVVVRVGRYAEVVDAIANTLEAAQVLIHQWPVNGGPKHARACDICLDALDGKADAELAREAFVEAATEAGNLLE